uniref:Uncharacterized protein n=1 Tax=Arundo donax TaxID=35708 RepID=A0A0A9BVD1_ARUDO
MVSDIVDLSNGGNIYIVFSELLAVFYFKFSILICVMTEC